MTEQIDYDPNTVLEALNNKADRDLNNVTDGTYQVLTTKNVTNCITKIPQNIKLELIDSTLTLKTGSKLYDGSGNVISITKDYTVDTSSGNGVVGVFYSKTQDKVWANQLVSTATSGETPPTGSGMFYNTVTKSVDFYKNGVLDESDWSLPLAIITVNEGTSTSIDQIFNGFGYIGSTIFALPGVKGLIPNGRNTDGSLNNTKFTTTNVMTFTESNTTNAYSFLRINQNSFVPATANIANRYYDEEINYNIFNSNIDNTCRAGFINVKNGRITSFNPKTTFQAIDRNNKEEIIGWGMPDYDAGIDITAYNSTSNLFVAPCAGFINVVYLAQASNSACPHIGTKTFGSYNDTPVADNVTLLINEGEAFYCTSMHINKGTGSNVFYPMKGAV